MQKSQEEKFLRTGHFLGLKFQEGWWFIHVLETEMDILKPWILLNENENRGPIGAQTSGTEDDIDDINANPILIPGDQQKELLFQARIGIAPSRMQLFYLYGRERNNALEIYDEGGDPAPIVNGFDSPYNNPEPISEVFTLNDMAPLRLQAFNPMDEAKEARISVHVNKIKYATVTNVNLMNSFLQGQIPARLQPAGRGAERENQIRAPNWLRSTFGEHIKTTQSIFEEADQQGIQGSGQISQIPGNLGGGTEGG
jgi:hypothetical protein